MNDPGLNNLLKWGVRNSANGQNDIPSATGAQPDGDPARGLDAQALAQLLGGPSDADLMRESMAAIESPEVALDDKLVAFDNFEQLVENIDNANNMEGLGLWMPLARQLDSEKADLRRMAAWCIGTAVQNNAKAQERALVLGVIPKLAQLAVEETDAAMRKKAIFALSSEVRNYQPAWDEAIKHLPKEFQPPSLPSSAEDMEQIDVIMTKLRERSF